MSWWAVIKNRRNIKIPKRRDTKEVPTKYAYSRPAIKTKEQIQSDKEKLRQKGERQKKINDYIKNIEHNAKEASNIFEDTKRTLERYQTNIEDKRETLEDLESVLGYEHEIVLSRKKEIDEMEEEAREHIAYKIKNFFMDNVERFVELMKKRNESSSPDYLEEITTEASLRETVGLDEEDKQRIEKAFANTKKTLIELYEEYDNYVDIFKYMSMIGKKEYDGEYDKYQKLKDKLR